MKPLQKASIPPSEIVIVANDLLNKWKEKDPQVCATFPANLTEEEAAKLIATYLEDEINNTVQYRNDTYQVAVRIREDWIHLSIKRNDRQVIHDWRDLQEIKNQILGRNREAVELYPAESRLVDSANQYHLWSPRDPHYKFPFGFDVRMVGTTSIGNSVNREFENAQANT